MSRHTCGGQGTTLWRWSSPSTSMWVPGILCNDVMISGHQACIHVLYLSTYLTLTAVPHLGEKVQKEPRCVLRALRRTIHWPCVPSGVTEEERCSRWRKPISFAPTYQPLPTGDPPDRRTVETMAWDISDKEVQSRQNSSKNRKCDFTHKYPFWWRVGKSEQHWSKGMWRNSWYSCTLKMDKARPGEMAQSGKHLKSKHGG